MKQFLNPRLKVYNELLCKYDIVDKEFTTNISLVNNLKAVRVFYYTNNLNNLNFSIFLDKEFTTYQRISLISKVKQKFKTSNFLITLRSLFLYMYLELLINSYFFTKNSVINKKLNSFTFTFHQNSYNSFLPDEVLTKLDSCNYEHQSTLISLFFQHLKCVNLDKQLNYYFISILSKLG